MAEISYKNFQKFSGFILQNHFEGFKDAIIRFALESEIPLIVQIKKEFPEKFNEIIEKSLKSFLEMVSGGTGNANKFSALKRLEKGELIPGVTSNSLQLIDISLIYSNRKKAFIGFLKEFTSDIDLWQTISLEMESYFSRLEQISFKSYEQAFEEKIRKEQRFLELVINNIEEGILAYDNNGKITIWNHQAEALFGLENKLRKNSIKKLLNESGDLYSDSTVLNRVFNGEKVELGERKFAFKEGFYEIDLLPIIQGKSVIGGINIYRDISEIKAREEKLRKSRDYYLTLLDEFPALIWRVNKNGINDYVNKTWLKFTGHTLEDELKGGWEYGVHPEDISRCRAIFGQALRNREQFFMEYRLLRFDGEYRWLLDIGQPIFSIDGEYIGFLGVCYDIQDQRDAREKLYQMYTNLQEKNEILARTKETLRLTNLKLEERISRRTEELKKQNLELKKINTDLDNFIYTASHDLKAPIANIEGLVAALYDSQLDEDSRQTILNLMVDSIVRFKNTIQDLTEISRAQKENHPGELVNFSEVLDDVQLVLKEQIKESGVEFEIDLKVEKVLFSRKNLRSIIYNLISNAIKFKRSEVVPYIHVKSYKDHGYIYLEVSDNGIGFNNEQQEKIFHMFKRLHDHVEGTGVGLYIVKRIMENADGTIEVESKVDEGTRFLLRFLAS